MHKRLPLLFAAALAASIFSTLGATTARAQSMSTVAATATVTSECNITATPMAFGVYDPVVAHDTADLDSTATISISCTKGTAAWVALGPGLNPSGTTRRMISNLGDYLTYELHQDTARTFVWNEELTSLLTLGPALSMAPRNLVVYGRVFGNQDVRAGAYTDSVLATVNF